MTNPHVPGYPGARLPSPWERELTEVKRDMAKLEGRLARLEQDHTTTRAQLHSYTDEAEDSQVTIPTDAPPRAKVALGALAGLTPTGRLIVLLAVIAAAVTLLLKGIKLI